MAFQRTPENAVETILTALFSLFTGVTANKNSMLGRKNPERRRKHPQINAVERRRKKIYGVKYLNLLNINAVDSERRFLIFSGANYLESLDINAVNAVPPKGGDINNGVKRLIILSL